MKAIVAVLLVTVFSQANAATVGNNAACDQPTSPDTCDTDFTCMKTSGCTQGTCQCTSPTVYIGSACLTPVKITEACTDAGQCPVTATCSTVCTCPDALQTADNMKCLLTTDKKIGVTCTAATDTCYSYVSGVFVNGATETDCVASSCICIGAYKTVGDHCEHIALDETCGVDADCAHLGIAECVGTPLACKCVHGVGPFTGMCPAIALDETCGIDADCAHLGDAECVGTPLACKCVRGVEPFTGVCPTAAYTGGYNLDGQDCLSSSPNPFATCVRGTSCVACPEDLAITKCRGTINADAASLLNTCLGQTDGGGGGGGSGVAGLAASLITVGLSTLFTLM